MQHKSRTINQSRTWAHALVGRLERHWQPSAKALCQYQLWDTAARECRGKSDFYAFRRYGLRYRGIVIKRDKALADLLMGPRITDLKEEKE